MNTEHVDHRHGNIVMSVVWPSLRSGTPGRSPGEGVGCSASGLLAAPPGSASFCTSWRLHCWAPASCGSGQGTVQKVSKVILRQSFCYFCYVVKHQGPAYWERPVSTIKPTKMKTKVPPCMPNSLRATGKSRVSAVSDWARSL